MSQKEVILELKDVKTWFKVEAGMLKAVNGVNLTIHKGETLGLVGESGCGKSTLGRTIMRLYKPNDGQVIYKGKCLNDRPYGTIHRIAASGRSKGVAAFCFQWAMEHSDHNVKIDTHDDNKVMQHILTKYGFQRCGIIYVKNGTERIAYQMTRVSDGTEKLA